MAACSALRAVADTLPPLLPLEPAAHAAAGGGMGAQQQQQGQGSHAVSSAALSGRRALTEHIVSLAVDWLLPAVSRWVLPLAIGRLLLAVNSVSSISKQDETKATLTKGRIKLHQRKM